MRRSGPAVSPSFATCGVRKFGQLIEKHLICAEDPVCAPHTSNKARFPTSMSVRPILHSVIHKETSAAGALPKSGAEESDQLHALAFAQTADGLRRRDTAVRKASRRPGGTHPRQREEKVVHLGRLHELGWLAKDLLDSHAPCGELFLQPCPADSDLVRLAQGSQALVESPLGSSPAPRACHRPILGDRCPSKACDVRELDPCGVRKHDLPRKSGVFRSVGRIYAPHSVYSLHLEGLLPACVRLTPRRDRR